MKPKKTALRKPTFSEALVPLLGMVLLLGIGYGKYGLPIQFLLIVAAFLAAIIAKRCGYTWDDMRLRVLLKRSPAVFLPC